MNLNRTENTLLDFDSSVRTEQFKIRFGRAMRLTVAVNHPAGHERAMTNLGGSYLAFDHYASSTNQESVKRNPAASFTFDRQRIGTIGVPVEQTNHGSLAVGRSQLQTLVLLQMHVDLLNVNAAVHDLNNRVGILR